MDNMLIARLFNSFLATDIDDLSEQLNGERQQVLQVISKLYYTVKKCSLSGKIAS